MDSKKETTVCSCGHENPSTLEVCEHCQLKSSTLEGKVKKRKKGKEKSIKEVEQKAGLNDEVQTKEKSVKEKNVTAPKMKFCTCGKRNKKMARYCILCNRDISYEVAMTEIEHQCFETGVPYHQSMEVKKIKKKKISRKKHMIGEEQLLPSRVETNAWLSDGDDIDFSKLSDFYCRFHSIEGNFSILVEDFPFSIGRGQGPFGNYLLTKTFVSRNHAIVTWEQDGIYLKHLGNTNPTCINESVIYEKTKLFSGDELGFGGNRLGSNNGQHGEIDENIAYVSVEIGRK